jgi:hypothetical protein
MFLGFRSDFNARGRTVRARCGVKRSGDAEGWRPRVWENILLAQTTMSNPSLPPELLDYIVDFLRDELVPLKQCCLVSKSWVPRTRRHLFSIVGFESQEDVDTWKKAFPDPSNSPAHYTRILKMRCFQVVAEEDVVEGGWIPTFPHAMRMQLNYDGLAVVGPEPEISLAPFSKFSPNLKSLSLKCFFHPRLQVFNLIRSLPFLEDLTLVGCAPAKDDDGQDGPHPAVSSISPRLTGTLEFLPVGRAAVTVRRLLDLPHGIHFRTLKLSWSKEEDHRYLMELVVNCSDTLENLDITHDLKGTVYSVFFWPNPLPQL